LDNNSTSAEPKHPIQVVSRRTDLSADVLRAWERRYTAVQPARSPSGRRLYSDADIARLLLLRRATLSGRSIAQVAQMPDERLQAIVAAEDDHGAAAVDPAPSGSNREADQYVRKALAAAEHDGATEVHRLLLAASDALGPRAAAEQVLQPLLESFTTEWPEHDLAVTLRHMASALSRAVQERHAGN
jgi:DNA-binding transcriptional MerR regulator